MSFFKKQEIHSVEQKPVPLKNPMMTDLLYEVALKLQTYDKKQMDALEKELREDEPKSAFSMVMIDLIRGLRQKGVLKV